MSRAPRFRIICILLMLCYVGCSCAAFYLGSLAFRAIAVFSGLIVFFLMVIRYRRGVSVVALFLLISCFALVNTLWSDSRSIFLVLAMLAAFGISWAVFELKLTRCFYDGVFFLFLGITFFLVVFEGYGPKEFNVFMQGSSRNVYSALMLASALGYVLSSLFRGEKPSLLLLGMFVALSFPLYGRSAIAFSVLLVLIVIFCCYRRIFFSVSAIGIIFVFVSSAFGDTAFRSFISGTNFESGLESARFDILKQYVAQTTWWSLLVGGDYTEYSIIEAYGDNPHNAFLRLHGYWGAGLAVLILCFWVSLILALKDRNLVMVAILLIALARAFFDIVYLFNLFDYLFFPAIFYGFFRPYYLALLQQPADRLVFHYDSKNGTE